LGIADLSVDSELASAIIARILGAMNIRVRILANAIRSQRKQLLHGGAPYPRVPSRRPWWESLPLPHGTIAVLTAQAAEYDAALERYVGAVLADVAARGWHQAPPPGRRRVVVPLTADPPRLPPAA
jgi:hypothetical protein